MSSGKRHILIVEDDPFLADIFRFALEDAEFKETIEMDMEFKTPRPGMGFNGDLIVHFAESSHEARLLMERLRFEAVFLDHDLSKNDKSAALVPDLLRTSPRCDMFLMSNSPKLQREAVEQALIDADLKHYIPLLKQHDKGNHHGFTAFINAKIRPPMSGRDTQYGAPAHGD